MFFYLPNTNIQKKIKMLILQIFLNGTEEDLKLEEITVRPGNIKLFVLHQRFRTTERVHKCFRFNEAAGERFDG